MSNIETRCPFSTSDHSSVAFDLLLPYPSNSNDVKDSCNCFNESYYDFKCADYTAISAALSVCDGMFCLTVVPMLNVLELFLLMSSTVFLLSMFLSNFLVNVVLLGFHHILKILLECYIRKKDCGKNIVSLVQYLPGSSTILWLNIVEQNFIIARFSVNVR